VPPELETEWLIIGVELAEKRWLLEDRAMIEGKFKIPAEQVRSPEDFTEDETWWLIPKFIGDGLDNLERFKEKAKAAAMDDDVLKTIRQKLKDEECLISHWRETYGTRIDEEVSVHLNELEHFFRKAGDDILDALNTPPEQRDPAKWVAARPRQPATMGRMTMSDPRPVTRDPLIAHRDPSPTDEAELQRLRRRARARKRRRLSLVRRSTLASSQHFSDLEVRKFSWSLLENKTG